MLCKRLIKLLRNRWIKILRNRLTELRNDYKTKNVTPYI